MTIIENFNVEITTSDALPCSTSVFTIDEIKADEDIFGSMSSDG